VTGDTQHRRLPEAFGRAKPLPAEHQRGQAAPFAAFGSDPSPGLPSGPGTPQPAAGSPLRTAGGCHLPTGRVPGHSTPALGHPGDRGQSHSLCPLPPIAMRMCCQGLAPVGLWHWAKARLDVPSSPPDLAGAVAAKSRHRWGQGLPPCLSPCNAYIWACSPHRQRDLEGKSRAAVAGVAWSQGCASVQLWEECSSSPTAWVGLCWHMCGWRGEGREPSPCWGTREPWWAAALSRARTVLMACPKQTFVARMCSGNITVSERWKNLTSKGSQLLHHSRNSPDRHNALSGSSSCASRKRLSHRSHRCHRGGRGSHCDITLRSATSQRVTCPGLGTRQHAGQPCRPQNTACFCEALGSGEDTFCAEAGNHLSG